MSARACPTELELDQAFSVGADAELLTHLDTCGTCRAIWEETHIAIELALELPVEMPRGYRAEERRTALLAASSAAPSSKPLASVEEPRPRHRMRWAAVGATVAASIVAMLTMVRQATPPADPIPDHPRRGVIHPRARASFSLAAQPPDELVRLRDGVLDIDVDPLSPGERFRVVVGRDQVEVRGTSFEVVAVADHLVEVHVVHGRVEVTVDGAEPIVLNGGESWRATPLREPVPVPVVVAPPAPLHAGKPRTPGPSPLHDRSAAIPPIPATPAVATPPRPQEAAFNLGYEAMRQREYGRAAAAFDRAVALEPNGALTEDAMFWYAVAVGRLHRTAQAIAAFHSFLDAYPASTRAGEASVMLGWLLVETQELDEARRRFRAAHDDPDASARSSAAEGLEVVDGKKR